MTQRRRKYAALLCLLTVLLMVVSSAYLIHEADHDCAGEECAVCEQIFQTKALLRGFALLWVFGLVLAVAQALRQTRLLQARAWLPARHTLVSWKVRMDD